MHSWEIAKWQANIFEDVNKGTLGEENLINAILEVAGNVAKLREELQEVKQTNVNVTNTIPHFPSKYGIRIFGIKIPISICKDW
jgi:hypothetical protein